jgi:hypothetical protein
MYDRINAGEYSHKLPYSSPRENREAFQVYRDEYRRLEEQFKADALAELGLTNHPKAELLFTMARANSSGEGYRAVYEEMEELSELMT